MDLIESLQRKTNEIVEDSSAENNDIEENAGATRKAAMEDNKATPKVSKIPEEGYGEMKNDSTPTRTRYKRACKRESPDGGKNCLSPNGVKKIKLSGKVPDVVIGSTQNGTIKPEIPENDKKDVKPPKTDHTTVESQR